MEWRKQHEQLAVMTGPTKGLGGVGMEVGGMDMEEEVKEAYEVVKRIDVLDVSVGANPFRLGICFSFKTDVDGLQRARRSGLRLKTRTMNVCLGSRTRFLQGSGIDLARRGMQRRCLGFSQSGQRYVLSLPIVIFLLNDTRVDSWCDTGVPDSTKGFGNEEH